MEIIPEHRINIFHLTIRSLNTAFLNTLENNFATGNNISTATFLEPYTSVFLILVLSAILEVRVRRAILWETFLF